MKTVTLTCNQCGVKFEKAKGEYVRKAKKGYSEFYCSRSCSAKRPENIARMADMRERSPVNITDYSGNKADKYTGIREHLRRVRGRGKECDLTLDELLFIWEAQKGTCAYTGVNLIHPNYKRAKASNNYMASLDRIDSSIGYTASNVQFVSVTVNYMKNTMSEDEVLEFFSIISDI